MPGGGAVSARGGAAAPSRRRWTLSPPRDATAGDPERLTSTLAATLAAAGLPERLHLHLSALLAQRGLTDPVVAGRFLDTRDATLHDPALLPDAPGLIARLRAAAAESEPVLVVGDFDADGLTGAAILIRALRAAGAIAEGYIPQRDADGHGIPEGAISAAVEDGVELLIAVDCGTADRARVEEARDAGILVGIVDHHAVPPEPARAAWLVNPNRPDATYPFPKLAGSGLAFKIAQGILADHPERRALLGELSVLAMIGGIADMVPVEDEFRVIVRSALKVLNGAGQTPLGIAALLRSAGAEGPYRVDVVGFTLAPRINSAGRLGDARPALDLLTTDDPDEAAELAAQLEAINTERRSTSRDALEEARALLGLDGDLFAATDPDRAVIAPSLVAIRGGWSVGVLGLVAGRIAEEVGRPVLVAHQPEEGALRCSVRAPRGFSVAAALERSSTLLLRHGGHDGAGGCSFESQHWAAVIDALATSFAEQGAQIEPTLAVDLELVAGALPLGDLATLVDALAPTGIGNPDPLFLLNAATLTSVRLVGDGRHARLTLDLGGVTAEGIAFGRPDAADLAGGSVDLVARVSRSTYRGQARTELQVMDLRRSGEPR